MSNYKTRKDSIEMYLAGSVKSSWNLYISVLPYSLVGVIFESVINVAEGGSLYQDLSLMEGSYIKHN